MRRHVPRPSCAGLRGRAGPTRVMAWRPHQDARGGKNRKWVGLLCIHQACTLRVQSGSELALGGLPASAQRGPSPPSVPWGWQHPAFCLPHPRAQKSCFCSQKPGSCKEAASVSLVPLPSCVFNPTCPIGISQEMPPTQNTQSWFYCLHPEILPEVGPEPGPPGWRAGAGGRGGDPQGKGREAAGGGGDGLPAWSLSPAPPGRTHHPPGPCRHRAGALRTPLILGPQVGLRPGVLGRTFPGGKQELGF